MSQARKIILAAAGIILALVSFYFSRQISDMAFKVLPLMSTPDLDNKLAFIEVFIYIATNSSIIMMIVSYSFLLLIINILTALVFKLILIGKNAVIDDKELKIKKRILIIIFILTLILSFPYNFDSIRLLFIVFCAFTSLMLSWQFPVCMNIVYKNKKTIDNNLNKSGNNY